MAQISLDNLAKAYIQKSPDSFIAQMKQCLDRTLTRDQIDALKKDLRDGLLAILNEEKEKLTSQTTSLDETITVIESAEIT